jgi:peptidoglycan hydrolase-like protein with peptidoglycan-binding domain
LHRCRTFVMGLLIAGAALPVTQAHAAALSLGTRDLRPGMHGHDVRVLQGYLTQLGIRTPVDGQYGPTTTSHVRTWERKAALRVDGRMSRQNAAILRGQVNQGTSTLQGEDQEGSGGAQMGAPDPAVVKLAPGQIATVNPDGTANVPVGAPPEIAAIITAGNEIVGKPYRYGGGHKSFDDSAYDCSGSVSYALHGAGLVKSPMDSTEFESWGEAGAGTWITTYANSGHVYVVVAGIRFDTGMHDGASGPQWSAKMRSSSGYTARHPDGF